MLGRIALTRKRRGTVAEAAATARVHGDGCNNRRNELSSSKHCYEPGVSTRNVEAIEHDTTRMTWRHIGGIPKCGLLGILH